MLFRSLLATSLHCVLICPATLYVPTNVAPMMISGIRYRPLLLHFQDDQSGLRIAEDGERLRGSMHIDGNGRVAGVSLHHCSLTNNDIRLLSNINGLRRLYLSDLDFRGLDLDPFSSIGALESLTITESLITESQLAFTSRLTRLSEITVSGCELAGDFLLKIPNARDIKGVHLSRIRGLKGSNINRFLGAATAIEDLFLDSNGLTNADLIAVAQLTECKNLFLRDNRSLTSDVCRYFVPMRSLSYLNLSGTLVGDTGVEELSRLGGLISLELANTPIGDGLKNLAGLDKLKELGLANTRVGDKGLEGIVRSRNLKNLNLSGTLVTDTGLMHLSGLKSLEVLKLSKARVSDGSVHTLAGLRNLVRLDLSGTLVGDGIAQIGDLGLLAHLNLAGTKVGDSGVKGLSHCGGLATLDLSGTPVHDNAVGYLAKLGSLEELNLAGTSIGDIGAGFLATFPALHTLNLAGTRIGDDGLTRFSRVGFLTVSGTRITSRGILGLVSQRGIRLVWIDITDTGIESVGENKLVRQGDRTILLAPFSGDSRPVH
jgi:internalin A